MFQSRSLKKPANKNRPPMKEYTAEGIEIPLQRNWLESWTTLPQPFDVVVQDMLDYEVRSDDVFVVTFPKSGTTWMQEAVWLLLNNLDFAKSKEMSLMIRGPHLESQGLFPTSRNVMEFSKTLASPRSLKSHMPANLLPRQIWQRKSKLIYVARNCKDVIVSYYHFAKSMGQWLGDNLTEFVDDFLNDEIMYTNYWTHVVDFWKMCHESNVYFVTYEEMQRDLPSVLRKLCEFLEKPQLTQEEMQLVCEHLSFKSMRENKQTNLSVGAKERNLLKDESFEFIRRGIVGSYKDELTPELRAKIDNWSQAYLALHDLTEEDIFGKLE